MKRNILAAAALAASASTAHAWVPPQFSNLCQTQIGITVMRHSQPMGTQCFVRDVYNNTYVGSTVSAMPAPMPWGLPPIHVVPPYTPPVVR